MTELATNTLVHELARSASVCRRTLERYALRDDGRQRSFATALLLAAAGFEAAASLDPGDPTRRSVLGAAARLGREAAETVRRHGLDPELLRCAAACERAAWLCDRAI